MSEEIINKIKDACENVNDPHMGISIVQMGILKAVDADGSTAKVTIQPTNPSCMSVTRIAADVKHNVESVDEIEKCEVTVIGHVMAEQLTEMFTS